MTFLLVSLTSSIVAQMICQEQSMWCWAACIQSSLSQANVYKTQSDIVSRLVGWPQDRPANNEDVIAVLRSFNFRAWEVQRPANPLELYNTLNEGWKIIAFVNPSRNPQLGHYIMLQGIAQDGSIMVSDPAPTPGCQSYNQNISDLYERWNWGASIVVGTPSY
ncbi:papain-like cysteine protease family protein [Gillisia hiemivivida]|uniref:papain-like cysteine protease family protein n=1 Tax=Gillisia hiemivivida TaxID=291190 RepID=UPI0014795C11|nr:papain-like cysteine protease family protein [Gillisia hiemivivida]